MSRVILQRLIFFLILGAGISGLAVSQPATGLVVPGGTRVVMAMTRPVWALTAKAGDLLYAQTVFPVTVGGQIGIPAGTYVQAKIDRVAKPTWKTPQAEIRVEFTKLIMADGYTVVLNHTGPGPISNVTVNVSTANDLLLDNGSQVEMTLGDGLALDLLMVEKAIPLSKAPDPRAFQTATLCRWISGSPGTPGFPGTPGTPPTVIPGTPGSPPTAIPGTPSTPGTPGTAGYAGRRCPLPPMVVSSVAELSGSQ